MWFGMAPHQYAGDESSHFLDVTRLFDSAARYVPSELRCEMKPESSKSLGEALLAAVGLTSDGVVSVTLKCEPGKSAVLSVERLIPAGAFVAPVRDLAQYDLVERPATGA